MKIKKRHLAGLVGLTLLGLLALGTDWLKQAPAQTHDVLVDAMTSATHPSKLSELERAMRDKGQDLPFVVVGWITELAPDSQEEGEPVQHFTVKLLNHQRLTIAHRIQAGKPTPKLAKGQELLIRGRYFWTPEGGELRGTYTGPGADGWLRQGHTNYF
ncbi:DUF3465 domain-containing protein [Pseudaeromonas sp. ZJS20]|uniref:DUF3465 domain-containing protein n=1 Tax=Pseudaeromonas aegiceratis TaxID=3153928 RepID=UPI00390CA154